MDTKVYEAWVAAKEAGNDKLAKKHWDALVVGNYPLARTIAVRYKRYTKTSTEIEDLTQAGVLGIMRSLATYNPVRAKFSTYATFFIIHEIQNCIHKDRKIGIPKTIKSKDAPMKFVASRAANRLPVEEEGYQHADCWDNVAELLSVLTPSEMAVVENIIFDEKVKYPPGMEILKRAREKMAVKARELYKESDEGE